MTNLNGFTRFPRIGVSISIDRRNKYENSEQPARDADAKNKHKKAEGFSKRFSEFFTKLCDKVVDVIPTVIIIVVKEVVKACVGRATGQKAAGGAV